MQQEKLSKKPVVTIALITAISLLGNEMLFIVLPIYWKFFGLTSLWQVGVLLSANRIIRLPLNPLVGWCYQKINKRNGILIAVILAIISTFSYGVVKGFWLLLTMRIIWGIAWSFLRLGGYLTVISSSNKKTRGHFIGIYNGLWGLGALFGMLIGGIFAEVIGIRTITTGFAILGLCSIPFVIRFIPTSFTVPETKEKVDYHTALANRKKLIPVLTNGLFIAFVVYGIFSSTLSKVIEFHIDENLMIFSYTLGAAAIAGMIQAIRMGLDPFIAPQIGRLSDQKFGRIPLLIFALLIGAICLSIIPTEISFTSVVIVILVFQFISTLLITTSDSLAADISNGPTSIKTMTLYTLFVDLGSALGPLISFFIIDFIGLHWLYWITSLLMILALVFWTKGYQRQPKNHFSRFISK